MASICREKLHGMYDSNENHLPQRTPQLVSRPVPITSNKVVRSRTSDVNADASRGTRRAHIAASSTCHPRRFKLWKNQRVAHSHRPRIYCAAARGNRARARAHVMHLGSRWTPRRRLFYVLTSSPTTSRHVGTPCSRAGTQLEPQYHTTDTMSQPKCASLSSLDDDTLIYLFSFLDVEEILRMRRVSPRR